jgi:hypothetical protein
MNVIRPAHVGVPARAVEDEAKDLRHYCRYEKCGRKLPAPVSILRNAFCCLRCFERHYKRHCAVCQEPIEQPKHGRRIICKKAKCEAAYRRGVGRDRYVTPGTQKLPSEVPENKGPKPPVGPNQRPWRIAAGNLSPTQFRAAIVPDGPGCRWEGGFFQRTEAKNKALLDEHFAKLKAAEEAEIAANGEFVDTEWREVISPDGVRCYVAQRGSPVRETPLAVPESHPNPERIPDAARHPDDPEAAR